jgi:hypothetical protein
LYSSALFGQYDFIGFKENQCGIIPDLPYYVNHYQYGSHGSCYEMYYKGVLVRSDCEIFGYTGIYDVIFLNDSTFYIIEQFWACNYTIYKTENNGLSWTQMGYSSCDFQGLFVINSHNAVAVAAPDSSLLRVFYLNENGGYNFYYDTLESNYIDTVQVYRTPLCTDLHELNYRVLFNGDTLICKMILDYDPFTAISSSANKIHLYPNPADSEITIESDYEINRISIYDICGKKILSCSYEKNLKIEVGSLQKGYYLIKAESDNSSYTAKFIKE